MPPRFALSRYRSESPKRTHWDVSWLLIWTIPIVRSICLSWKSARTNEFPPYTKVKGYQMSVNRMRPPGRFGWLPPGPEACQWWVCRTLFSPACITCQFGHSFVWFYCRSVCATSGVCLGLHKLMTDRLETAPMSKFLDAVVSRHNICSFDCHDEARKALALAMLPFQLGVSIGAAA